MMNPSGQIVHYQLTCYLPRDPAYRLWKIHYTYGPYDGQKSYYCLLAYSLDEAREKYRLAYPINLIEECHDDPGW